MSGFKKLFSGGGKEEDEPVDTIGADDDDGKGFMTESVKSVKGFINLNWKEKIIGFTICIIIAAIFVIVGCAVANLSGAAFAVLFSIGTIAAVCSTFFLVGPIAQAKKFVDFTHVPEAIIRISAAITFVVAVILGIVCGVLNQPVLAVLLAIVQFAALVTYAVTLIPFAMTAIVKGFKMLFASA